MNDIDPLDTQLTARQQIRIAALNAAIAMGITNPKEACDMGNRLFDWIAYGDAPVPPRGVIW